MQDKFLPQKWFNEIFTEITNCDVFVRPSKTGFVHPLFYFSKRPGLATNIGTGWTYDRQLDGDIAGWHYYNNIIYSYSELWTLYSFDGDLLTSIKTWLWYDSTFSDETLQVSYLGWGRYPNKYTVYTVKTYNATAGTIEINETLSTTDQAALAWKFVYMKTWPSQRWERSISSTTATVITLNSGFGVSPVAGDVLWIYSKMVSQSWYPQLREWSENTYIFSINSAISVAPSIGDTYTNNWHTYTITKVDLSSGKWEITSTSTWSNESPTLSGTLTKATGSWDSTITFYDSDKWSERFYARDTEWNEMYWYYPNDKKVLSWDNKIIWLHKNWQTILPRNAQDFEQILATKIVTLWSASAMNISVYGWYLIVFFADRIWLLRKTIIDTSTQDYIYTYQDLLDFWLYSEKSYIIRGGNLYIFWSDNRLYSITLTTASNSEVKATPKDQWALMIEYFQAITWGEVTFEYSRWVLRMIHSRDDWLTDIYKYFESYEGWIVDKYSAAWNLFKFMYNIGSDEYVPWDDKIYRLGWLQDWTDNIEQVIKLEWPLQEYMDIFTAQKIKRRLWFDGETKIGCNIKTTIWGSKKYIIEKDITKLTTVDSINQYITWSGTLGWWLIGDYVVWGEAWVWEIVEYYSDYIDIATNIGKKGSYIQIEFSNNTESQMIFWGVKLTYFLYNPNVTYNKLVI